MGISHHLSKIDKIYKKKNSFIFLTLGKIKRNVN